MPKKVTYDRDEVIKKLYWEGKSVKIVAEEMGLSGPQVNGVIKWLQKTPPYNDDAAPPKKMGRDGAREWYEKHFGGAPSISSTPDLTKSKKKKADKPPKDTLTFDVSVQVGQWDEITTKGILRSTIGRGNPNTVVELKRYRLDVHNQILPLMFYASVDNDNPVDELKDKQLWEVDVVGINLPDADTNSNWESGKYPMKVIKLADMDYLRVLAGADEKNKDAYSNTINRLVMLNGMPRVLGPDVGIKKHMGITYTVNDINKYRQKDATAMTNEMELSEGVDNSMDLLVATNEGNKVASSELLIYDYPNVLTMYRLLYKEFYAILNFFDFYDNYLKKDKKDLLTILEKHKVFVDMGDLAKDLGIPQDKSMTACTDMQVDDKFDKDFPNIVKVYDEYCTGLNEILPVEHKMSPHDIIFYHQLSNLRFYNAVNFVVDFSKALYFGGWIGSVLLIAPRDFYDTYAAFYHPFKFPGLDIENFNNFEIKLEPGIRLVLDYYDLLDNRKTDGWSVTIETDKMVGTKLKVKS